MDWSHMDYCDVFISYLNSHYHGTHSLQREWWVSDVVLNFSKSATMKKQNHLHLVLPEGEFYLASLTYGAIKKFLCKRTDK